MDIVYKNNPDIAKKFSKINDTEYEKKCSTISYFLGTIENHIVYFVYKYLVKNGGIIVHKCLPEMDGICMPRIKNIDYQALINNVNSCLSPIKISFKIYDAKKPKPYSTFVLYNAIKKRELMDDRY